jgi:hypothetical protein
MRHILVVHLLSVDMSADIAQFLHGNGVRRLLARYVAVLLKPLQHLLQRPVSDRLVWDEVLPDPAQHAF